MSISTIFARTGPVLVLLAVATAGAAQAGPVMSDDFTALVQRDGAPTRVVNSRNVRIRALGRSSAIGLTQGLGAGVYTGSDDSALIDSGERTRVTLRNRDLTVSGILLTDLFNTQEDSRFRERARIRIFDRDGRLVLHRLVHGNRSGQVYVDLSQVTQDFGFMAVMPINYLGQFGTSGNFAIGSVYTTLAQTPVSAPSILSLMLAGLLAAGIARRRRS